MRLFVHERGADLLVRTIDEGIGVERELMLAEPADPTAKRSGEK
jgi:hypothetical protein